MKTEMAKMIVTAQCLASLTSNYQQNQLKRWYFFKSSLLSSSELMLLLILYHLSKGQLRRCNWTLSHVEDTRGMRGWLIRPLIVFMVCSQRTAYMDKFVSKALCSVWKLSSKQRSLSGCLWLMLVWRKQYVFFCGVCVCVLLQSPVTATPYCTHLRHI